MLDDTIISKHITIRGRVQAVGFRYHMSRVARELGVTGWVRNRGDGSVEAMVAGTPDAVEKIITWARRGPKSALVAGVQIDAGSGSYAGFETLPTA